ncbi:MAG: 2-(3-amino-3-carboxypropyl)histidine synthase [Methanomassiliicoccales archaeon PtaU1.Bin124]|nr:MAG: 2-(3-amino-3-carboxypropyl)histidine synthase [Methanomassiliicoccales archaeon PtaU1.Bin124]
MYDFHLDDIIAFVRSKNARTVALQMPEGLKTHALRLSDQISEATGARCIIIGDPCYGACDLYRNHSAIADVLVHLGHAAMPSLGATDRVLFVEVGLPFEIEPILKKAMPSLIGRIGIVTTIQHSSMIRPAMDLLRAEGKEVFVGIGDTRIHHPGQVLGCNVSSAIAVAHEVDTFLYIGSGNFHPLSVALQTGKKVVVIDPITNEVRELGELSDRILRQRHAAIARSRDVQRFGVLVSSKVGQARMPLALDIVDRLKKHGRKGDIIVMEEVRPEQLLPYEVGGFVSTACPRLAIDDQMRYPKPILTPQELEIVLGERSWDDYRLDMIDG